MADEIHFRKEDTALWKTVQDTMRFKGKGVAEEIYGKGAEHLRENWEAYHFTGFIAEAVQNHSNAVATAKDDLDAALESLGGIQAFNNLPSSRGISKKNSEKALTELAKVLQIPKIVCLVNFLKFCIGKKILFDLYDQNKKPQKIEDRIKNIEQYIAASQTEKSTPKKQYQKPFQSRIAELRSKATYDRRRIIVDIGKFLHEKQQGYITVCGDAGTGKSSVLVQAIDYFLRSKIECVWHFNSFVEGRNSSLDLIESLFNQLSQKYDLESYREDYKKILATGKHYSNFIDNVLEHLANIRTDKIPLVIIIDALDEVDPNDPTAASLDFGNTQTIPVTAPDHVYFLISSRSFEKEEYRGHRLHIDLSDISENSYQKYDIEAFIKGYLKKPSISNWMYKQELFNKKENPEDLLFRLLCEKSAYVFIYLFYVFENIDQYDIQTLPSGLDGYYLEQYRRLLMNNARDVAIKKFILVAITHFLPSISIEAAAAFSSEKTSNMYEHIRDWLRIKLVHMDDDPEGFLKFFHLSFYDFIKTNKTVASDLAFYINSQDAYKRLATHLVEIILLTDEKLSYKKTLSDKRQSEIFRIILDVLIQADDAESLATLLTHRGFCEAVIKNDPKEGKFNIVHCFQKSFEMLQKRNEFEKSDFYLSRFFKNITPNINPVLTRQYVFDLVDIGSSRHRFYDAYMVVINKERQARMNC